MTTATQPQTQQPPSDMQAASALAPIIAAGVSAAAVAAALATVAGVTGAVASGVVTMTATEPTPSLLALGPALSATLAGERAYRAAYLVASARRVQAAVDRGVPLREALAAEAPNFRAHVGAQRNRRRAALAVDKAAARHGLMLGWRARMDSRTSAECAQADGKNFAATQRPLIGWPGSVHPHCRCRPVAAFAGAGMVDDATQAERKVAVAS